MTRLTLTSETRMRHTSLALAAAGLLGGCAGDAASGPGQKLQISSAPLTLDGVEEVTYGLRVRSANEVVWEQTGLTSTQYGDGKSAITYIGPCDASADANPHSVELWIENIKAGGVDLQEPRDFINPAHADAPVIKTNITCLENADVPVEFNLTVLRNAQQGFFDIAVNFEDIFCSAKVDCQQALLHHGDARDATVVVAFACTSGEGQQTVLSLTDLELQCTDGETLSEDLMLSAGAGVGQHGAQSSRVFEYAVYQGDEQLTSNGQPLEKCFWNRAIGLDLAALQGQTCSLSGFAAASEDGDVPPANSNAYPAIYFNVDVLTNGQLCGPNPLNGEGSGVQTVYVTRDGANQLPMPLTASRACEIPETGVVACKSYKTETAPSTSVAGYTAEQADNAITIRTAGGATTIPMTGVLAGWSLGQTCCMDGANCCVP